MINVIKSAIAQVASLLKALEVKRFVAAILVGFLLLTTNVAQADTSKAVTNEVKNLVNQDDSDRPKTTGQWNKEARQTEDAPGQRLKRIGKESAEAVKDFGSMYVDTADRSTPDIENPLK